MTPAPLRLGTRGSQLALYQANTVARLLTEAGEPPCELVIIKTSGDKLQERPLSEVGGKRLFVKEIEDALVRGEIDLAVHSSKDMPALLPDGLAIAVSRAGVTIEDVIAVGLDTPGPASATGVLSAKGSTNFVHPQWAGFDLPGNLSIRLHRPVSYLNDGNAGALWGHFIASFSPNAFYFDITFRVITMMVVGGMGSVSGSVIGPILIITISEALRRIEDANQLYGISGLALAILFIVIIIARPGGLLGDREIDLSRLGRSLPFARKGADAR